mmetsp:Transcript_14153/g.36663  ORF Transcript_14153/g.36663 Transcript_14153/m.36663 type:complete len:488 (-) Transcript_14153:204-1667(-)
MRMSTMAPLTLSLCLLMAHGPIRGQSMPHGSRTARVLNCCYSIHHDPTRRPGSDHNQASLQSEILALRHTNPGGTTQSGLCLYLARRIVSLSAVRKRLRLARHGHQVDAEAVARAVLEIVAEMSARLGNDFTVGEHTYCLPVHLMRPKGGPAVLAALAEEDFDGSLSAIQREEPFTGVWIKEVEGLTLLVGLEDLVKEGSLLEVTSVLRKVAVEVAHALCGFVVDAKAERLLHGNLTCTVCLLAHDGLRAYHTSRILELCFFDLSALRCAEALSIPLVLLDGELELLRCSAAEARHAVSSATLGQPFGFDDREGFRSQRSLILELSALDELFKVREASNVLAVDPNRRHCLLACEVEEVFLNGWPVEAVIKLEAHWVDARRSKKLLRLLTEAAVGLREDERRCHRDVHVHLLSKSQRRRLILDSLKPSALLFLGRLDRHKLERSRKLVFHPRLCIRLRRGQSTHELRHLLVRIHEAVARLFGMYQLP